MGDWFSHLDALESFFLLSAIGGGLPLIIVFILQFFLGGGEHSGIDDALSGDVTGTGDAGDLSGDVGDMSSTHATGVEDASSVGAALSFKFLSFQGITAFFTMFGLVGFALYRQSELHASIAIAGGVVAGLLNVWIISRLFAFFNKLQSSGMIDTASAVNCTGEVYLNIPAGGTGKVMVTVQNRLREYEAVSVDGRSIATGTRIKVIRVSSSTLVVRPTVGE